MNTLTNLLKGLFAVAALLAFCPAHAQNNPVASSLVMSSMMPVAKLNSTPAPEENAHFYDDTCKDLGRSLVWIQEVNANQPTFWNLYTEARIHLRMKNLPAALATAIRAKQLAEAADNSAYTHLSAEVIRLTNPTPPTPAISNAMASTR